MKRRGNKYFIAGGFVLILLLSGILYSRLSEPRYNGRTVSEWLEILYAYNTPLGLNYDQLTNTFRAQQLEAYRAIQNIGTNQLPDYLEMMHYSESPLSATLKLWLNKLPMVHFRLTSFEPTRMRGALAIHALGSQALAVKPELVNTMTNDGSPFPAAYALAGLGPEVLPDMVPMLSHSNDWVRNCAIWVLAQNGKASRNVVTNLESFLRNSNAGIRGFILGVIGRIGGESEWLKSTFERTIQDPDPGVRRSAIEAMMNTGLENSWKKAFLTTLTDDSDGTVSAAAKRRLQDLEGN